MICEYTGLVHECTTAGYCHCECEWRGAQDSDLRCRREGQGMQLNATAEGEGGEGRKAEQKLVSVASKFHDGRHINSTMEPISLLAALKRLRR